ncbi:MAG: HD domain-containing protein [bacterium]
MAAILTALDFAAEKHRNQRRKDAEGSPYINHAIAVASVLAAEAGVRDRSTLVAAVLHDTVEDTDTSFEELEGRFGPRVAELVRELTDDKSLEKEKRKELQVEHAPLASPEAKRIKIADKICNVRDVTANPPAKWPLERRRRYLDWAEQVVAGCRGVEPALEELFDRAIREGRRRLGVQS